MLFRMLSMAASLLWASGGEIFGDIRVGDTYLVGAPVELKCGAEVVKGTTDKQGSFRLAAKSGGKCVLSVTYEKATPSVEVVLFDKPARYRLVVDKAADGSYVLKRV